MAAVALKRTSDGNASGVAARTSPYRSAAAAAPPRIATPANRASAVFAAEQFGASASETSRNCVFQPRGSGSGSQGRSNGGSVCDRATALVAQATTNRSTRVAVMTSRTDYLRDESWAP